MNTPECNFAHLVALLHSAVSDDFSSVLMSFQQTRTGREVAQKTMSTRIFSLDQQTAESPLKADEHPTRPARQRNDGRRDKVRPHNQIGVRVGHRQLPSLVGLHPDVRRKKTLTAQPVANRTGRVLNSDTQATPQRVHLARVICRLLAYVSQNVFATTDLCPCVTLILTARGRGQ